MEISSSKDAMVAIATAMKVEGNVIGRYRTAAKAIPNESARRLFMSIIAQKQKHSDRLAEMFSDGVADASASDMTGVFYTAEVSSATLFPFLQLCIENETWMRESYERLSAMLDDPDARFLIDGFIADERKMITWLTDFHDLLAMTSDLKQA